MAGIVDLKDCIAPSFYKVHHMIKRNDYSEYWLAGGRGSTKSAFASIEIVLGIVKDPTANAICFRKVADTLRTSVYANILWAIDKLDLEDKFICNVSPMVITYIPTGQQIMFRGLDKSTKLKSIKPNKGNFKIIWFEELEEFSGMNEIRSVMQSVIRGDDTYLALFSYNPPQDPNSWVNTENNLDEETYILTTDVPYRHISQTTYLTVPPEWLGEAFIQQAKSLERRDPKAYEHEYLGHAVGNTDRIVFSGKFEVMDFETPPLSEVFQNRFFIGLDWGFAQDPTACLRCFIMNNCLWVDYETGQKELALDATAPKLKSDIPDIRNWTVYADCARPESIEFVARHGNLNILPAPKWTGSVEDGVEYLRSFDKIIVHTRCTQTAEEMKRYSHKVDKTTGEVLPKLEDKWNHFIDALRYALCQYITNKVSILDVI